MITFFRFRRGKDANDKQRSRTVNQVMSRSNHVVPQCINLTGNTRQLWTVIIVTATRSSLSQPGGVRIKGCPGFKSAVHRLAGSRIICLTHPCVSHRRGGERQHNGHDHGRSAGSDRDREQQDVFIISIRPSALVFFPFDLGIVTWLASPSAASFASLRKSIDKLASGSHAQSQCSGIIRHLGFKFGKVDVQHHPTTNKKRERHAPT